MAFQYPIDDKDENEDANNDDNEDDNDDDHDDDNEAYMQKAGDTCDISLQIFLDFPQNFRLRTRNQYCTQAIAWGSTI